MFSNITLERRVPVAHPLRGIRRLTERALERLSGEFSKLYSATGRSSIPQERLLRALLLMVLYSVHSERPLMEQLNYNLLFRWFAGLEMDDGVWDVTVFTKSRERRQLQISNAGSWVNLLPYSCNLRQPWHYRKSLFPLSTTCTLPPTVDAARTQRDGARPPSSLAGTRSLSSPGL